SGMPSSGRLLALIQTRQAAAAGCLGAENLLGIVIRRIARSTHGRKIATAHDGADLGAIEHFALEKQLSNLNQFPRVRFDDGTRPVVAVRDDTLYFFVDADGRLFAVIAMLGDLTSEKDLFVFFAEAQRTEFAHAPLADHLPRHFGGALNVVAGAGSQLIEIDFLGDAAAHQDCQLVVAIGLAVIVLIVRLQLHRDTERHPAGNDG